MKLGHKILVAMLAIAGLGKAMAAVPPAMAEMLGGELTPFGAAKAGNADGTIPAWTGGQTQPPADYESGSGKRPDPWADEVPYLVITRDNMAEHAEHLTDGTQALLERYGGDGYKVKVWPTHRSFAAPDWYYENTIYNATHTRLSDDGLRLEDIKSGTPFPIPQNGLEVYWNHLLRWEGTHIEAQYKNVYKDKNGTTVVATEAKVAQEWPHYNPDKDYDTGSEDISLIRIDYTGPGARTGEKLLMIEPMDFTDGVGRRAWQYLKGQRRVRRAPAVAFDQPNRGAGGFATFDDANLINGSPERFDWKLIGKKEMYVPYNSYTFNYVTPSEQSIGEKFINPDFNRWEKHRVWVVEATLKEGAHHIYQRRVFYFDEDTWTALAAESYDDEDRLWRIGYAYEAPNYEVPSAMAMTHGAYDLQSGTYYVSGITADSIGIITSGEQKPLSVWSAAGLAAGGVR